MDSELEFTYIILFNEETGEVKYEGPLPEALEIVQENGKLIFREVK